MEGVTVLATETVNKSLPWVEILTYFFIAVTACGFLLTIFFTFFKSEWLCITGLSTLVGGIGLTLIFLLLGGIFTVPDYTKYEVILDDSVSMNKFMNTYEILEQRGQIYVIKEKEE